MTQHYDTMIVDGESIASRTCPASAEGRKLPAILWLGGFNSDMSGTKSTALYEWATRRGRAFRCFDYFAHGYSSGDIRDFTISRAVRDAHAMIGSWGQDRLVLVGSSMGGWVTLRLMQDFIKAGQAEKFAGIVLIAPAPDFTQKLLWPGLSIEAKASILETGSWTRPSAYSEQGYIITRKLIDDGRENLVLHAPLRAPCPVHILHGTKDADVPASHSTTLMNMLEGNVKLTLIKDGDHRLSSPEQIATLLRAVEEIA